MVESALFEKGLGPQFQNHRWASEEFLFLWSIWCVWVDNFYLWKETFWKIYEFCASLCVTELSGAFWWVLRCLHDLLNPKQRLHQTVLNALSVFLFYLAPRIVEQILKLHAVVVNKLAYPQKLLMFLPNNLGLVLYPIVSHKHDFCNDWGLFISFLRLGWEKAKE